MAYSHVCTTDIHDVASDFRHVHITQSDFYAAVQRRMNRTVIRVIFFEEDTMVLTASLIFYPLLYSYMYGYAPYGPTGNDVSEELACYVQKVFREIAITQNAVFIRLDWNVRGTVPNIGWKSFVKTYNGPAFQPRNEWRLMVQKSDEELFAGMHEKHRYSIRAAEKREVQVDIATQNFEQYFDIFYNLMESNAKRNHFYLHDRAYYEAFFKQMHTLPHAALVLAKYKEDILCMYVLLPYKDTMQFVFGASSDHEKNRMPTYMAHYEGMKYARAVGCVYYNFGGIESVADRGEGMKTLTKYKKRYGGEELEHAPFYDVVSKPFLYMLYCVRKFVKG